MKPGKVVRFRLPPRDCISVLDVAERANINTNGKSFNSICHTVFSGLLETLRKSGEIPTEQDEFAYSERMRSVAGNGATIAATAITNAIPLVTLGKPKMSKEEAEILVALEDKQNRTAEEQQLYNELCQKYF